MQVRLRLENSGSQIIYIHIAILKIFQCLKKYTLYTTDKFFIKIFVQLLKFRLFYDNISK